MLSSRSKIHHLHLQSEVKTKLQRKTELRDMSRKLTKYYIFLHLTTSYILTSSIRGSTLAE